MSAPDCILWPWTLDKDGYGQVRIHGHKGAHRIVYAVFNGPIPDGLHVLHTCDTPACVNPAHLKLGTHADNMRDKRIRKRQPYGTNSPLAKLTAEQVRQIRDGLPKEEALQRFGIRKSTYYVARNGRGYEDVGA